MSKNCVYVLLGRQTYYMLCKRKKNDWLVHICWLSIRDELYGRESQCGGGWATGGVEGEGGGGVGSAVSSAQKPGGNPLQLRAELLIATIYPPAPLSLLSCQPGASRGSSALH